MIRPNLLNNLRFAYRDLSWRVDGKAKPTIRDLGGNFPGSAFGATGLVLPSSFPAMSAAGRFRMAAGYRWWLDSTDYQIADHVDYIRGAHKIRFGLRVPTPQHGPPECQSGNGSFNGTGNVTGLGLPDLMLGQVTATISPGWLVREPMT